MIPAPPVAGRALLIAGLVVLALAACGRRGPLEAPPDPSVEVQQKTQAEAGEDEESTTLPSPTPTPRKGPRRGYTIPKEPFILDPLL